MNYANYQRISNSQDPIFLDPQRWAVGECQRRFGNFQRQCAANGCSASPPPDPSFAAITTDPSVLALSEDGCTFEQIYAAVKVYASESPSPADGHFAHLVAMALQGLPGEALLNADLERLINLINQAAWQWGFNAKISTWAGYQRVISEVNLALLQEYLVWLWRDKGFRSESSACDEADLRWSSGNLPIAMTLPPGLLRQMSETAAKVSAFLGSPRRSPAAALAVQPEE